MKLSEKERSDLIRKANELLDNIEKNFKYIVDSEKAKKSNKK